MRPEALDVDRCHTHHASKFSNTTLVCDAISHLLPVLAMVCVCVCVCVFETIV